MAKCEAKTKSGTLCQINAMPNGRCYRHGGASTGAPKGNKNALKHGAYSKFYTDDELGQLDDISTADLESELKLCKVQLIRALKAADKQALADDNKQLDLVGQATQVVKNGESISRQEINKKYAKTDYAGIIDRLVGRIQSLTQAMQDMGVKAIDYQMKMIELETIKSAMGDSEVQPVKIVIQVEDGRINDKPET